jgi:uncharacterized protein YqhQ
MSEEQIIVGGQAVIEGVMMRAPHSYAVAVRRADGTIVTKGERLPSIADKHPILKVPVLRGTAVLIQSMVLGIKSVNFSAGVVFNDAQKQLAEDEKAEKILAASASTKQVPVTAFTDGPGASVVGTAATVATVEPKAAALDEIEEGGEAGSGMPGAAAAGSIVFALALNVVLFILLPLLLTNILFVTLGTGHFQAQATGGAWYANAWAWLRTAIHPVRPTIAFNLVDGLIRMSFFLIMIWSMSLLRDIRRLFEYHGAEHKVVFTWEAGEPLTVENARRKPRQHPRCGTSFLMLVMLVAIVAFSVVRFDSILLNLATRILLLPFIAGISYEILRASARSKAQLILSIITQPGLWLQNVTTKEPDDAQLEVSITALKASLSLEPEAQQLLV